MPAARVAAMSSRVTSVLPQNAASASGRVPFRSHAVISAEAASRALTVSTQPRDAAAPSGKTPRTLAVLGSAPAASSSGTSDTCPDGVQHRFNHVASAAETGSAKCRVALPINCPGRHARGQKMLHQGRIPLHCRCHDLGAARLRIPCTHLSEVKEHWWRTHCTQQVPVQGRGIGQRGASGEAPCRRVESGRLPATKKKSNKSRHKLTWRHASRQLQWPVSA